MAPAFLFLLVFLTRAAGNEWWWSQSVSELLQPQRSLLAHAWNIHSQTGDDGIAAAIFEALDISQGFFVDVGAADGLRDSNTRLLARRGWGGVLIESDPRSAAAAQSLYANRSRLSCSSAASCALAVTVLHARVVVGRGSGSNRHDERLVCGGRNHHEALGSGGPRGALCGALDNLLDSHVPAHPPIDYLSIDIDGLDTMLFQSLRLDERRRRPALINLEGGFDWHPRLACPADMEVAAANHQQPLAFVARIARDAGYRLVAFTQNAFLLRRDLFDDLRRRGKLHLSSLWRSPPALYAAALVLKLRREGHGFMWRLRRARLSPEVRAAEAEMASQPDAVRCWWHLHARDARCGENRYAGEIGSVIWGRQHAVGHEDCYGNDLPVANASCTRPAVRAGDEAGKGALAPQWWLAGATRAELAQGVSRHGTSGSLDLHLEPILWQAPLPLPVPPAVAETSNHAHSTGHWLAAERPFRTSAIAMLSGLGVGAGAGAGIDTGEGVGDNEAWGDVDCVVHLRPGPGRRQRPIACRVGLLGALPVQLRRGPHSYEAMRGAEWSSMCLAAGFGCDTRDYEQLPCFAGRAEASGSIAPPVLLARSGVCSPRVKQLAAEQAAAAVLGSTGGRLLPMQMFLVILDACGRIGAGAGAPAEPRVLQSEGDEIEPVSTRPRSVVLSVSCEDGLHLELFARPTTVPLRRDASSGGGDDVHGSSGGSVSVSVWAHRRSVAHDGAATRSSTFTAARHALESRTAAAIDADDHASAARSELEYAMLLRGVGAVPDAARAERAGRIALQRWGAKLAGATTTRPPRRCTQLLLLRSFGMSGRGHDSLRTALDEVAMQLALAALLERAAVLAPLALRRHGDGQAVLLDPYCAFCRCDDNAIAALRRAARLPALHIALACRGKAVLQLARMPADTKEAQALRGPLARAAAILEAPPAAMTADDASASMSAGASFVRASASGVVGAARAVWRAAERERAAAAARMHPRVREEAPSPLAADAERIAQVLGSQCHHRV